MIPPDPILLPETIDAAITVALLAPPLTPEQRAELAHSLATQGVPVQV